VLDWLEITLLAFIQGLSEFLPISSSAHLVLPSLLFGWQDQGLFFDVVVHVGTLGAVLLYFRRDLYGMIWSGHLAGDLPTPKAEILKLALATSPVVIAGFFGAEFVATQLRGLEVIATTTIVFGLLLGASVIRNRRHQHVATEITWAHALVIGCWQVLALIPGVSRSGVTITAGLWLGYTPAVVTRFSFLLSIPVIAGAITFMLVETVGQDVAPTVSVSKLLCAFLVAGGSAYWTIAFFFRLLDRWGLLPFVWYRLGLGAVLVSVLFM
jgi:undecaprenyl-diphosphatase